MRHLLAMFVLLAAPALLCAVTQSSAAPEPAAQATNEVAHPQQAPNRATSHDRHMRKRRAGTRHRHHRTSSKNTAH